MSCFIGKLNHRVDHLVSFSWKVAIAIGSFRSRRLDTNRSISIISHPIKDRVVRLEVVVVVNTITEVVASVVVAVASVEVAAASTNR
jgi:hypothetical protein